MAVMLTAALAWHSFVKAAIGLLGFEKNDKVVPLLVYAIIVSAIMVGVLLVSKRVLGRKETPRPIMFAVAPTMM